MFRIGEFSKLVRVSARMLRHYEKCGLLYPAEIDHITGYRLYSIRQTHLLNRIVKLRDMGFSIDEIGDILPHFEDTSFVEKALQRKTDEVQTAIAKEQDKLDKLMDMSNSLKKERDTIVHDVELKELPKVMVISLSEIISDYSMEEQLWGKLFQFVEDNNIPVSQDEGAYSIYMDDEYKEQDIRIEIALPVEEAREDSGNFVFKELESLPLAATIKFSGSYENYGLAMEKLGVWIEDNGYEFAGNVRGIALNDLQNISTSDDFLTELQIPVRKATKS